MKKSLSLAIICGGLFLLNLYLAAIYQDVYLLLICVLWLYSAIKNYKNYKSQK